MQDTSLHRNGCVNLVVPTSIGSANFVVSHDSITDDILNSAIEILHDSA
jgi:hypothetical protein